MSSTSLGGPPSVFYLGHRPVEPWALRDTLVALNLVRVPLSLVALGLGGVFVLVPGLGWMTLCALAVYFVGERVFRSLDASRHETVVVVTLSLAALSAVLGALI